MHRHRFFHCCTLRCRFEMCPYVHGPHPPPPPPALHYTPLTLLLPCATHAPHYTHPHLLHLPHTPPTSLYPSGGRNICGRRWRGMAASSAAYLICAHAAVTRRHRLVAFRSLYFYWTSLPTLRIFPSPAHSCVMVSLEEQHLGG